MVSIDSNQISDRNPYTLLCQHCQCVVLQSGLGNLVNDKQIQLPHIRVSTADSGKVEYEDFDAWWFVRDVMTFENVGVTNATDGRKYLCCADCEVGPIGVQIADEGYYLAPARLKNKTD